MTANPSDPDTLSNGTDEEDPTTGTDSGTPEELDAQTPEADAAEQHTEVRPSEDDPPARIGSSEADEADAAEQARIVTLDEDDYR
ncbi:hypothetical protein OG875_09260 [Streptomyces sp. NBC_01498]|uniref:hypothetical protein n=1 Tax=Streptomyces sp. NBC_01498 TaxID=2975870 RepID=UPI002E7B6B20|nr:hypothetical protein [Streptomyces sp. NBC_01498]WTL24765.1 hypothetical protein OG875_09260 [Streptomyces sp. NBC_01498]